MTIAWNHACGEMVELAGALKAAADAHPVAECCEPPHLRHQLEFDNGIRICFTRNVRSDGERYHLSIRGETMPTDAVVEPLIDAFFGEGRRVLELTGIKTPNVRCFARSV